MYRSLSTLLVAGALAAPALSDGLDKTRVPAGARIVAHLDVEALVASRLAQELKRADADVDFDMDLGQDVPMLAGVRPLRDVRSVTIFTADAKSERFAAVLRTSASADTVLQAAIATEPYQLVPLAGWQVHSWREGDGKRLYGAVVPLAGTGDRLVLASNDPELMSQGIAVLEGKGATLAATARGQLAAVPTPGAIVFVASDQPIGELGEIDPSSSVARLVQGLVLQLGEAHGALFAELTLTTATPDDAYRVQQVLQGLTALASLVAEDAEQGRVLQRLVSALRFQTTGSQLYVAFSYDLQALIQDLEQLEQD